MPIHKADPAKFITRGAHEQRIGYAPWLAHVLDRLYEQPPKTARELVERSAKYMGDKGSDRWKNIEQEGCERIVQMQLHLEKNTDIECMVFGPAGTDGYGAISKQRSNLYTAATERKYYETLSRHYPHDAKNNGDCAAFKMREFCYPVPSNGNRTLALMKIGLWRDIQPGASDNKIALGFKHPELTPKKYDDFIQCVEPLFEIIQSKNHPSEERKDAAITFYWLMAQVTPATRGGTAHARITLEYLASVAGFEVLHLKEGYDLWAEAASSNLKDFLRAFKETDQNKSFFDSTLTSQHIMQWQESQWRENAQKAIEQNAQRYAQISTATNQLQPKELESAWLKAAACLDADMECFPKGIGIPEYFSNFIENDIVVLANLSKRVIEQSTFSFLEKLQPNSTPLDGHTSYELRSSWAYLKDTFSKDILPRWREQIEAQQQQMPHELRNGILLEAVKTLASNLPNIIAKADEHATSLALIRRIGPSGKGPTQEPYEGR